MPKQHMSYFIECIPENPSIWARWYENQLLIIWDNNHECLTVRHYPLNENIGQLWVGIIYSTWSSKYWNTVHLSLGAKIGPEEAFYLYACGPDFTSVMPCKYGRSITDYSKYIDKEILQCDQIKELLMTKREVDTGPLIVSS